MPVKKGKFIAFEGLDGSGQSTQASKLLNYLKKRKEKVHLTKEPTNNLIGGLIRGQLTHDWRSSPECLQLLFAADRAHHLEKEIMPMIEKGVTVITDRYFFSTIAFGSTEISDWEWLKLLNKHFPQPDLTVVIKTNPKTCLKRIQENRFSIELFEKTDFLERTWRGYEKILKEFQHLVVIDGEQDQEKVFNEIQKIYGEHFD